MRTPSESDFVAELKRAWPRKGETPSALLARADEASSAWPKSAAILRLKAALIQLAAEDSRYSLEDALECYKRALAIDPLDVEPLEALRTSTTQFWMTKQRRRGALLLRGKSASVLACRLTTRWSGRVDDKVPSPYTDARAAQLNR